MKQVLLLFTIILLANQIHAQTQDYTELWAQVEKFEKDGLPKSALNIVEQIQEKAEADNNTSQEIKSILYQSKYALTIDEDAQLNIINNFKTEIEKSDFPKRNILENMLAHLYWQYFNQNRWQFYNRTKTSEKVDSIDFGTWDLETLFEEIHHHFQNSLKNGLMLQQEKLDYYSILIENKKDSKTSLPTLYDFLNHNALQFYKTNETQITQPSYKFEIDNAEFLSSPKNFSNLRITSKDSLSLQLNALKIYQDLIQFHEDDTDPNLLTEVNIERLKFVHENATFNNRDSLLLATFKLEEEHLKSNEASALYNFEIASFYYKESHQYQPNTDQEHRWKAKEALEICHDVLKYFPKSAGAEKCKILKSQILQESLNIQTETYLPIQTNGRLLVSYKNINNLDFKIYKVNKDQFEKLNKTYRKDEQLQFIKGLKVIKEWNSKLKNEGDYQTHTTEIVIPKLDNGLYIIFADSNNLDNEVFSYGTIQITNIALVENETPNNKTFQFINRSNGKPLANTRVEISFYNRNNRTTKTNTYTTNNLGEVQITKDDSWYNGIRIKARYSMDEAYFEVYYIGRQYEIEKEPISYRSFIFTDRSIYRPGQTVYFKGIAIKKDGNKSEVMANESVYATLYNMNSQEIKTLEFKTNEFGSVSGEFILPSNGLNGNYYIEFDSNSESIDLYSEHYFSVEEYKRPKFETKFKPVNEAYRVNDNISVKGEALAYAGSYISNAKVVYRVHRKVQFPDWYYWYRPWFNSEPQEITHGESTTNDRGEFEITFKSIPDTSVDKTSLPIFKYEITADVTDINGETRSVTTIVNVGYHALMATLEVLPQLDKNKKDHKILIETNNLNGEFVATSGTIAIYKLQAPNYVLRNRPWPAPDYQSLSKEEFQELFPHDAFKDEHDPNNWKKGTKVLETSFNTGKSKTVELGKIKNWESGIYIIILEAKDKFGQLVQDQVRTILYSDNDKSPADNQLFEIQSNKDNYDVDDTAIITLGSSAKELHVTVIIEKDRKVYRTEIITLNNNKKTIKIPVEKSDLGGFAVHYSFAGFNSYLSGTKIINVPYPKTDLDIETITFRDKLQPNVEESWEFKIKGPKGEKVSAELLASMYDASLDQFKGHEWTFHPINNSIYNALGKPDGNRSFGKLSFRAYINSNFRYFPPDQYEKWNWFGLSFGNKNIMIRGMAGKSNDFGEAVPFMQVEETAMEMEQLNAADADLDEIVVVGYGTSQNKSEKQKDRVKTDFDGISIRKNLQETAFFYPQLKTDKNGCVSFSFTTPESLTQWKLQLLGHTKDMNSTTRTLNTITQKELMVLPNPPRFLREGDQITISTKISNLTKHTLSGTAILLLTDALTAKTIDSKLGNVSNEKSFSVDSEGNTNVSWNLNIPNDVQAVQYKIMAKAGDYTDGEQNALPVLTNRMLVTETLPMWVKTNETRTFTLDKLASTGSANVSKTLKHHKLSLEITSNPAWYAVQALPYLMEYPYDCNEQVFSRYYANALASHIANSNPRIQEVFNQWKASDASTGSATALISNLEKNEELKSVLLEETPWLRDAQSETEQKKRIALLFDLNKMNNELQSALNKLKANQMSSGAWAWFKGGYENRFITQHIIAGFGHLKKLNVIQNASKESLIKNAINYLDEQFVKEYRDIRKYDANADLNKDHLSHTQLHYLYMRSFFPDIKTSKEVNTIMDYYQSQIQTYWLKRSLYSRGMMALVSHRRNDTKTASKILKSLEETSITSEEMGMYWKENTNSWYWYQAPIETQALLIEAFSEIEDNTETIDNLKIWLLKNKQTNKWKTTKATTEAVHALLLQGSDWLSVTDQVDVIVGGTPISPKTLENVNLEAGTGYFKTSWNEPEINTEMAEVKLSKIGKGIAWGALYWQYFEDLDKITSADSPLSVKKRLFLKNNTDRGEEITKINNKTPLRIGDLVRVRIEIRTDRDMEFIHLKDMRAAGLEPVNVLSQYKWQDGLGYYETTKDASTNFFFDYLPKGVYVFEYDLRVSNAGNMSNGITTIQSMYAPEFSSHSQGVRIEVGY